MISSWSNGSPLVSIVTPSLNKGHYLEATIESVLSQDYPAIEYIIMDGGSTDKSLEIIRRYAGQLSYWTSGQDGGHSAAVSAGWRLSHGEILAEIDASDVLKPKGVRKAVEALQAHPEWGMVYSDSEWMNEDGLVLRPWHSRPFRLEEMICGNYIPQPTVFMRRWALQKVGPYNPEFNMSMDFDLWMRIGRAYAVGYLSGEVLGSMRSHLDSKSNQNAREWLAENLRIIYDTLNDPRFKKGRARLEASAVGCAYARHAEHCVTDGMYGEARKAIWAILRSRSAKPWRRYGRDLIRTTVVSFLGLKALDMFRSGKRVLLGEG